MTSVASSSPGSNDLWSGLYGGRTVNVSLVCVCVRACVRACTPCLLCPPCTEGVEWLPRAALWLVGGWTGGDTKHATHYCSTCTGWTQQTCSSTTGQSFLTMKPLASNVIISALSIGQRWRTVTQASH